MSADLPVASAVETVAVEEKESPTELFITHMASLKAKLAAQKESTKEMEKELSAMEKLLKKVAKVPRAKRAGTHPKGEMPTQVAAWNGFLKSTLELMKSEGWPAFELTNKKGETISYPAGVEVDGAWVWDYEDDAKRKAPNYKTAMAYASYRKANGEFVDPGAEEREAAKAAKAAEKEEAKKRKAEEREAKAKPKKAAGGAGAKAETEAAPTKKPVAKKAAGAKAEPKKAEPKKAAPAAEEADENAITPWTHKGKKYLRSGMNECWAMTAAGKMGKWAGLYDPESDKIDASAPEPEVEFE